MGKIYFLLVRIKIKHMELAIMKRESTGSGPNVYHETETVTKVGQDAQPLLPVFCCSPPLPPLFRTAASMPMQYEIMDGAPVRLVI